MSEFIAGFAPILVMWALPLAPMVYAAVLTVVDSVTVPVRRAEREREPVTFAEVTA